jgi:biopolymer transport protein ExbB/TolQ
MASKLGRKGFQLKGKGAGEPTKRKSKPSKYVDSVFGAALDKILESPGAKSRTSKSERASASKPQLESDQEEYGSDADESIASKDTDHPKKKQKAALGDAHSSSSKPAWGTKGAAKEAEKVAKREAKALARAEKQAAKLAAKEAKTKWNARMHEGEFFLGCTDYSLPVRTHACTQSSQRHTRPASPRGGPLRTHGIKWPPFSTTLRKRMARPGSLHQQRHTR